MPKAATRKGSKAETRKGSKGRHELYNAGPPPRHDVGGGASGGETSTGPVFGQPDQGQLNPPYGYGNGYDPSRIQGIPPPARPYTREYQQDNHYRPDVQPPTFPSQPPPTCPVTVVESVTVNLGDIKDIKDMRAENTSEGNDKKVKKNFAATLNADTNIWAAYFEGSFSSLEALDRLLPVGKPRSIIIKCHDDDY
ncbi:hypothetical protein ACHAPZ_001038 [Fusarium culmorum]